MISKYTGRLGMGGPRLIGLARRFVFFVLLAFCVPCWGFSLRGKTHVKRGEIGTCKCLILGMLNITLESLGVQVGWKYGRKRGAVFFFT